MNRRALQVLGPSTGGIRAHVTTLAAGLVGAGWAAPVVGPDGVLEGIGSADGVVGVPSGMTLPGLLAARRDLSPWRRPADIVHAHGLKAGFTAVGGRPARPVVLTQHNVVLDASAGRAAGLQRRLERAVLRRADRVVAPTEALAAGLEGVVPASRVRVVLPVFPVPRPATGRAGVRARLGLGEDTPVVVAVSRLHPQKDLGTLVTAWTEVVRRLPEARLVVVGDGPSRPDVERDLAAAGVGSTVHLLGGRPAAADEMGAADVVVVTSVWEAVPLVLAESMLLGVPVVSTAVGLAPELLGDGAAGRVVPVGDAEAVADGLLAMLEDPAAARAAGSAARRLAAERFDPAALVAGVVGVYEELV